jgi:hypothetical protein
MHLRGLTPAKRLGKLTIFSPAPPAKAKRAAKNA